MSQPTLKKNLILSTAYEILNIITPFITAPYIARVLGADGIGIYSYTNSIQLYFAMFAALGIMSYGKREIARNRDNMLEKSRLFIELEILLLFTTSIILLAWCAWIFITPTYKIYYLILSFSLLNTIFDISWFYAGLERFQYIVYRNTCVKIITIILLFTMIKEESDLWKYILLVTGSTFIGSLSMWLPLKKEITWLKPKLKNIKVHFKETLVYFIPAIATSIYTILNKVLIGAITSNPSENGYYEQATNIVNMAKSITFSALNSVLTARVAYLFMQNKITEIKERIKTSIEFILFMGFGLTFGMIGISKVFIPIFLGPGYDKTVILLQLLSPIILIIGISNCLGSHYYTPAGYRGRSSKYLIAGSIANLIFSFLLIPNLMSTGAVISSLIAETLVTILYLKYCDGFLSFKFLLKSSWKKLLAGGLMLLGMYMAMQVIENRYIALGVIFMIGVIIYIASLWIFKDKFIRVIALDLIKKKL